MNPISFRMNVAIYKARYEKCSHQHYIYRGSHSTSLHKFRGCICHGKEVKAKVVPRDKETKAQKVRKKQVNGIYADMHALMFSFSEGNPYSLLLATVAKNELLRRRMSLFFFRFGLPMLTCMDVRTKRQ